MTTVLQLYTVWAAESHLLDSWWAEAPGGDEWQYLNHEEGSLWEEEEKEEGEQEREEEEEEEGEEEEEKEE